MTSSIFLPGITAHNIVAIQNGLRSAYFRSTFVLQFRRCKKKISVWALLPKPAGWEDRAARENPKTVFCLWGCVLVFLTLLQLEYFAAEMQKYVTLALIEFSLKRLPLRVYRLAERFGAAPLHSKPIFGIDTRTSLGGLPGNEFGLRRSSICS